MTHKNEINLSLKSLITSSWKSYKNSILIAIIVMVICGLLEGIGYLSLIPLLQFTGNTASTNQMTSGFHLSLEWLLIFYISLVSIISITVYANSKLITQLQAKLVSGYRCKLYHHYLHSNYQVILAANRSSINNLLTKEVERVGLALIMLTRLIAATITVALSVLTAFFISLPLTLIAITSGMLLYIMLSFQAKRAHQLGKHDGFIYDQLFKDINDQLNCIKMIKAYGVEKTYFNNFHATDFNLQQQKIKLNNILNSNTLWYSIGGVICFSLIFYISIISFQTPLPVLFVLLAIFSRLVPKISMIQKDIHLLFNALPAVGHVEQHLENFISTTRHLNNKKDLVEITLRHSIQFKNISFRYGDNDPFIFNNFNLVIPANKITAIVGPSGAGKSTLLDILMGLLIPSSGTILIDNVHLLGEDNLAAWQRNLAYVPRDSHLLQNTIRANLLLSNPSGTEEQMYTALEDACATEFVMRLPHKLDTFLGDLGNNFSAGEKQRLMLACALFRQPKLLILDEATNSIDNENEYLIYETLKKLREKLTIVLVTHNIHQLHSANKVIVNKL